MSASPPLEASSLDEPSLMLEQLSLASSSSSSPSSSSHQHLPAVKVEGRVGSPPDTPRASRARGEQRQRSSAEVSHLTSRIDTLEQEVSRLLNDLYEMQEFRHSSSHQATLSSKLEKLDFNVNALSPRIRDLRNDVEASQGAGPGDLSESLAELMRKWERVETEAAHLREAVKEDGWTARFRATADQADAMMEPLQRSLAECSRYVERITLSPTPVPFESELDELPSIRGLQSLADKHNAMRGTYVPSLSKILKMMDKSLSDRAVKNGEALRRFGDMSSRWTTLQRAMQQIDAKIRLIVSQHSMVVSPGGEVEILSSPYAQQNTGPDYFALDKGKDMGTPTHHRGSISSASSASSRLYPPPSISARSSLSPGSGGIPPVPSLRHKSSTISSATTATGRGERPPWNASPRVVSDPPPIPSAMRTPTARRLASFGHTPTHSQSSSARHGAASPTPSNTSLTSSVMSRPGAAGSRLPVISPKNRTFSGQGVPTLAVPHSQTRLSSDHLERARMGLSTPEPPRAPSRSGGGATPTMGNRTFSTPRTFPRPSAPRAPPSSFRATTPTPASISRPSSRLSSHYPDPSSLIAFRPSPYDLLDQQVSLILRQTGYTGFVSRLDAALKKGQRRAEGEEWKGEYVFGQEERSTPVKMLRVKLRGEERWKVMGRVGGMWVELDKILQAKR